MGGDSTVSDDEVHDALSDELGRLTGNATFRVAEIAVDGATIFEVSRDEHGTPEAVRWHYEYAGGALRTAEPDQWSEAVTDPETFYRQIAPKFVVCTPRQLPSGLRSLLPGPREVPVYKCRASLSELLRAAVKESPLVLGYELAVLARSPAGQNGAVRLALTGQSLFRAGETQGCQVHIRVSCVPTDADGTAFVVVTREPRPDLPPQARRLRPVQEVLAAAVPPGSYNLTALLTRPGKVRFQGLPVPLGRSSRSWADLQRLVPDQLAAQAPVHLVCLIETCGGDDRLQQRIYWLEELIAKAQACAPPLRVSVVAYGAHGVAWEVEDRPPEIRAWSASGTEAINKMRGLLGRKADEREYQRAAQLECALKLVRGRLSAADERPVIVTAGGRPAHPPELDTSRQLIPCPDWVDGMHELGRLQTLPGITFGAFRDPNCRGGIWDRLARDAVATVDDAVDMESFTADLGMHMAAQIVPFPVI